MTKTRHFIAVVDDEESIQSVDTPATNRRAGRGNGWDWRSRVARLPRGWTESQMNLTAASVSNELDFPALPCFVSRVLPTRIVLSNEVGALAAVLIYHQRIDQFVHH